MTTQEVWNSYHKDLQQFIISKVKDKAIADDLLQDSFLKIHTKLNTLKDITKIKSWIFTIARNSVLDYFKTANKTIEVAEIEIETQDKPQEHTEQDCLHGILKELPKKYRDPLFLSDVKGLKQAEIAKQLNLPLPTVKSQIQRGRKQIAQGFVSCCGFKIDENGQLKGEIQEKENCKVCK